MNRVLAEHETDSTRTRRLGVAAVVGAVCLGAAYFYVFGSKDNEYEPVRTGDIIHSYVANGRVESDHILEIVPEIAGRIQSIDVNEGDTVEPGQLLVSLDDAVMAAELMELTHAASANKAALDEVLRGPLKEELEEARSKVAELKSEADFAEARLQQTLRGTRSEEISQAEADVLQATAELDAAEKQLARSRTLRDSQTISREEFEEHVRRRDVGQAFLSSAKANLDRLKNGATTEEKQQSQASAAAAVARLRQAEARLAKMESSPADEEKRLFEARYQQAQATVSRLERTIAKSRIHSPVRGLVLRRYSSLGELAGPAMAHPILVIADLDSSGIRIEVEEGDIYKLRVGQTVEITSDGYVGQEWYGTVTRLAPVLGRKRLFSESPKEKVDVSVLEAWIAPSHSLDVPFHLSVEVRAMDTLREGVLIIPAHLVDSENRVEVRDGTLRKLELGARDDGYIEVISGLKEGDRIRRPTVFDAPQPDGIDYSIAKETKRAVPTPQEVEMQ